MFKGFSLVEFDVIDPDLVGFDNRLPFLATVLVTDLKVSVRTYYSPVGGTQVWPTTQVFCVGFFQLRVSVKRVRQINDLSKKNQPEKS